MLDVLTLLTLLTRDASEFSVLLFGHCSYKSTVYIKGGFPHAEWVIVYQATSQTLVFRQYSYY